MKKMFIPLILLVTLGNSFAGFPSELPQELTTEILVNLVISEATTPDDVSGIVSNFSQLSKAAQQVVDTSVQQLIQAIAKKFNIDLLLAALYVNTKQSRDYFDTQLSKLKAETKLQKLNTALADMLPYIQDTPSTRAILKTLLMRGITFKATEQIKTSHATYLMEVDQIAITKQDKIVLSEVLLDDLTTLGFFSDNLIVASGVYKLSDPHKIFLQAINSSGDIQDAPFFMEEKGSGNFIPVYVVNRKNGDITIVAVQYDPRSKKSGTLERITTIKVIILDKDSNFKSSFLVSKA